MLTSLLSSPKPFAITFVIISNARYVFAGTSRRVVFDDDDDFPIPQRVQGRVRERRAESFRSNFVDLVGDGTSHLLYIIYRVPHFGAPVSRFFARRSCVFKVVFLLFSLLWIEALRAVTHEKSCREIAKRIAPHPHHPPTLAQLCAQQARPRVEHACRRARPLTADVRIKEARLACRSCAPPLLHERSVSAGL